MADALVERFLDRAGLLRSDGVRALVEALRAIPYGRPEPPTDEGVVAQWRGTCSSKHLLLARCLRDLEPSSRPRVIHRVYSVTPGAARKMFGAAVAAAIPPEGVTDVHTYVVATLGGRDVVLDVTFPGAAWDGVSDMPVAAADGEDVPAGGDPMASKAALVQARCDAAARERFISALNG